MSLNAIYSRFLANPSADALADNASLNYITTLTTIADAPAILKHFAAQSKQFTKKVDKVLSSIESANGLCVDVETTIEFLSSGGAYLPGLDDNFLADRLIMFPVVHIVNFDDDKRISQIRLYWDQGSVLKSLEVIGARARNWPIRDGKDMIRLISTSASKGGKERPSTSAGAEEVSRPSSSRSSASATKDPHASLSLFQARQDEEAERTPVKPIVALRQSAKPAQRNFVDILGDEDPSTASATNAKIPSKSGAGKNYRPIRLFEEESEATPTQSPAKQATNVKKYGHFDFGEGEDAPSIEARPTSTTNKHQSQWKFEDFVTPHKVSTKVRGQDVRHFGWSDDEDTESPVKRPVVHQPRPDAKPHFEFADDGTPDADKVAPSKKGLLHNKGMGLYKDHVLGQDEDTPAAKKPLSNVTGVHINNDNRLKDFGANWEMADQSPSTARPTQDRKVSEDTKKVIKGLDAHWSLFDESPEQSKKENAGTRAIYKTHGNGMGGRKGAAPTWGFDDEETEAHATNGKGQKAPEKSFWDF